MTFGSTNTPGAQQEWLGHPPLPRQRCLENGDHPPRSPFSNSGVVWRSGGPFAQIGTCDPALCCRCSRIVVTTPKKGLAGTACQKGGAGGRNKAPGASAPARAFPLSRARPLRPVTTAGPRGRQPQLMRARTRGARPAQGQGRLANRSRRCRCTPQPRDAAVGQRGPLALRQTRRSVLMRCGAAAVSSTRTGLPHRSRCGPRGARPRDRVRRRSARVGQSHGDRGCPPASGRLRRHPP